MSRELKVYLGNSKVGRLLQDDSGDLSFTYDSTWLDSGEARPLSASLPLKKEPFHRRECRPFFAGLLSEESGRVLVARYFGVSDKNDFALLAEIGAECAGAVCLHEEDEKSDVAADEYRKISLSELAEKMALLPTRPLLVGEAGMLLSLAGAQGKLAVMIREGEIALPLEGAPSSHIIKPQILRFEGLVENEFTCMKLAEAVGLNVAKVKIGKAVETSYLEILRYDRASEKEEQLRRIHQEDFCQALAIPPALKYQTEGGPSLKKCFELVRSVSTNPGADVLALFDAVIFNFLVGNNDAHGKNFSFLYDGDSAELAPLYDLVCTQAYPEWSTVMVMKIGGEKEVEKLTGKHWKTFFYEAVLGSLPAARRALELAKRVMREITSVEGKSLPSEAVCEAVRENDIRLNVLR
ncbi:type II toxin-antitoxin system HipA family toxin [Akkermansiaceae bacterium]|nr:type II toxin-antitoxin system HipA family toxin [Akkermansiaceae bacterium]MDB4276776.1 type II toxin-antitoxin system HipA family toxin [bacterium]MDB4305166.1 type II toxin-antitoxin system HipA family toxin [Akkermansiaceae bacterium]MDB4687989.1 type II toxin-antitoxin system HipA family toxin [Akkermansiaceae bacterium]MDC0323503.1 type II toxin-antitoxin system HipA family toxin [Akkermansiaceae bacterium]